MGSKGYEYKAGELKPFICTACKRDFSSEGAFNLHKPCGPGYQVRHKGKKPPKGTQTAPGKKLCPECGNTMRLLNESRGAEKIAIKQGYAFVCDCCDEIA
jgi:hypothetical protein